MKKQNDRPLNGRRYMSKDVSDAIMEIAIGRDLRDQIDIDGALFHAMGTSVACLAARTMSANVRFLQDQVNVCCGEILLEKDFTREKFEEHLYVLLDLNSMVACMTPECGSIWTKKQSSLIQAFATLPQKHISTYRKGILSVRHILEEKILSEMLKLLDKISQNGQTDFEGDIRSLLSHKVVRELWSLHARLGEIGENIDSLVHRLREDWKGDLAQLRDRAIVGRSAKTDRETGIKPKKRPE